MKRKRIDGAGNVIERDEPEAESGVVGKIETPITDPLELPSPAMREMRAPTLTWDKRARLAIAEFHAKLAHWVQRRVLLIPDIDLVKMQKAQITIGQQHLGFANMVAEIRLRLTFYERHDPQFGKLRRQFNDEERKRHERLAAKRVRRLGVDSEPPEHPAPAEAVTQSDEDEPA